MSEIKKNSGRIGREIKRFIVESVILNMMDFFDLMVNIYCA